MATLTTFAANTLIKSAEVNANFAGLSDGSMDATANSLQQFRSEGLINFVVSGGVWSGDSYGVSLNASMTAMVVMINGRRITITAVTARAFTASKDTYVDVLDNLDGTGTLVYTTATNNAASPALAANSIRIAIIVSGASTIAAVGSVNQGQETKVLPIASSIPYAVTDSIGNMICNRDPACKLIGYRELAANFTTTTAGSLTDVTGLNFTTVGVPTGRKIVVTLYISNLLSTQVGLNGLQAAIIEDGSQIANSPQTQNTASWNEFNFGSKVKTPAAGAHTYKAQALQQSAGTMTVQGGATAGSYIKAELY